MSKDSSKNWKNYSNYLLVNIIKHKVNNIGFLFFTKAIKQVKNNQRTNSNRSQFENRSYKDICSSITDS